MDHNNRTIRSFIKDYTESLLDNRAALFAGAGLSVGSGSVSWKELLAAPAADINIDVNREADLTSVAQYIYNESNSRHKITNLIKQHIQQEGEITENHQIITRLPISTIWTTNYDEYLEEAFKKVRKPYDVKKSVMDLSSEIRNAETTIYKMHGDINRAMEAVLIKDDYEIYDKKNELFTLALKGDLISKSFLFIGFSFDDPNLESILSKVRVLLEGNTRQHYCFFKRTSKADYSHLLDEQKIDEEFDYEKNKQYLKAKDLERYGLKAIFVNEYEEITEILKRVESYYKSFNVFISGSNVLDKNGLTGELEKEYCLKDLPKKNIEKLAERLHLNGYHITSGYGLEIGSHVITGVLRGMERSQTSKMDDALTLKPFPREINDPRERKEIWTQYRKDFIGGCGTAVFFMGNKIEKNESGKDEFKRSANGVLEEFEISRDLGLNLIPIEASGFASKDISDKICVKTIYPNHPVKSRFLELNNLYQALGDSLTAEELIDTIVRILNENSYYWLNKPL